MPSYNVKLSGLPGGDQSFVTDNLQPIVISSGSDTLRIPAPKGVGTYQHNVNTLSGAFPVTVSVMSIITSLRTTQDLSTALLASTAVPSFAAGMGTTEPKELLIDTSTLYQTWIGAGAALTDSSASVLLAMPQAKLTAFLTQIFSPTLGLGLNFIRLCMGDSDYTTRNPNGPQSGSGTGAFSVYDNATTDDGLASFSTAQDQTYIDPILNQIYAINPNVITIMAPWSPPVFFKGNALLIGSASNNYYQNTPANNTEYAQYFVKTAQSYYTKHNRYPSYATLQNEPNGNQLNYTSCVFNGIDIAQLGVAVRAAFDAVGIPTQLLSGDCSWGDTNPRNLALYPFQNGMSAAFAGAAYHAYDGSASQMLDMAAYPGKLVMMTEMCGRADASYLAGNWSAFMGDVLIGSPYYGASVIAFWNLALAPAGQPGTADNLQPVATVAADGTITLSQQFYALAHLASYVKPGAVRCAISSFGTIGRAGTDVQAIAFKNLDGTVAPVLFNSGSSPATVTLKDQQAGNQVVRITLAAGEIRSLAWKNAAAVVAPDAPVAQAVAYNASSIIVSLAGKAPATGGASITGYDIWASTAQGGEMLIAANKTLPFNIGGLLAGNPEYVKIAARNTAGASILSGEVVATPITINHALNFTGAQNADVYGTSTATTSSTTGVITVMMHLNYQSYAAGSGGTMLLAGNVKASGASKSNAEWSAGSYNTTGIPIFFGYNAAGTYVSATGSTPWTGAPYKQIVNNGSTSPYTTTFPVGGSTVNGANSGGAPLSVPAGSTAFIESADGITWTQLGSFATTWGTGGINHIGASRGATAIGSISTTAANTAPTGSFYRLTVTDGTTILEDIDFTNQNSGSGPFPAVVGGSWTIYPATGSGISES